MNGKLIILPLHPEVVKKTLGKHAHLVEQLVKFMTSSEGERAIAQATTCWATFMTAQVVNGVMSEAELREPRERALMIMNALFDAPRLQLYSCSTFDFSVLSDVKLVDALIAICDVRDYRTFIEAFEDPMDKAGYPWARTALKELRELLEQAS